jgi:TolB protein
VPEHGGEKYAGEDGFFLLDAIGNPTATIDEVAADQAGHKLRPYGSQPSIESLQIQGQEARLILPSQDANMGGQAMLIVRYPQPVEIAGVTYQFFVLYADQEHVGLMAETLQFTTGSDPAVALVTSTPMPLPTSTPTVRLEEPPRPVPTPTVTPVSAQISSFEVSPTWVDPGDTITLTWQASGDRATLCPSARFVLFSSDDCQPVSLSGVTTFTIPMEAAGFQFVNFSLSVQTQGASDSQVWQVSVALKCHTTWFFSDEPQAGICPAEPIRSYAAAQRFERGTMIWLEQLGRYILLDEALLHEQDVRKQVYYVYDPLDIIRDTSAEVNPPGGFYAPESGFGLVWRGDVSNSPGYREILGWALAPEFGYEAVYQCDDALPSGGRSWQTCYLKGPDSEIVVFHPLGGWHLLGE